MIIEATDCLITENDYKIFTKSSIEQNSDLLFKKIEFTPDFYEHRRNLLARTDFRKLSPHRMDLVETLNKKSGELEIHIDMHPLRNKSFSNVKNLRLFLEQLYASQNVKLISKRAERLYPNGYCVYVLYCNRCKKRRATYRSQKEYRKRGTECPFVLKFTKINSIMEKDIRNE